jgi:hypothetical protein
MGLAHPTAVSVSGLLSHIPSLQIFGILCSDGGENACFYAVLWTIATKFPQFM